MPHIEKRKLLAERLSDTGLLHPAFRAEIEDLLLAIQQQRMPFIVYETYRTPQRQAKLIRAGFSGATGPYDSPHVHGLALDFLIDTKVVNGPSKDSLAGLSAGNINQKKKKPEKAVYNIGVNLLGNGVAEPRTVVENKLVLNFWLALGDLIERQYPHLMWGGNLKKGPAQLIGADPPHVELRMAKKLMRERKALKVLKSQGNPGLEGCK